MLSSTPTMVAGPGAFAPLDRTLALARRTGRGATWVSGAALIVTCLLVSVEVLLRKLFNVTLGGMDEISGYVLAVSVSWTLSFALAEQAHIRIDVLYNLVEGRLRALLDLLSLVSLAGFSFLLTYWAGRLLESSIDFGSASNSALQVPLWLPQSLWFGGLAFFSLNLAALLLRAIGCLITGDIAGVSRIAGIKSVEDEIEDQTDLPGHGSATQG